MQLYLTELEKAVLRDFLLENKLESDFFGEKFEDIHVNERRIEGSGFMVEITTKKNVPFEVTHGGRWLKASGVINSDIRVVFTVYVHNGKLDAIEGATMGESWPEDITNFIITHLP